MSFIKKSYNEFINENKIPEYIIYDGKELPTRNNKNEYISHDIESIYNFYTWFYGSKMVDINNRPIVCYHITPHKFKTFEVSPFGKMGKGSYFTSRYDDIKLFNKSGVGNVYKCYLKIVNLLEIENPFSKRTDDNDGIIAFKGKQGEEIVVRDPFNIKSVNNDGTWDSNDGDIFS